MADLFNIASTSANTFKKAIEVTAHNVANSTTPGYTRQVATIEASAGEANGASGVGGGSKVVSVTRQWNQAIQEQLVFANSLKNRYEEQLGLSKQIEGIVASNDEGIQEFMQRFYDSAQNLSNDPTSDTNRRMLLDETGNMQTHLRNLSEVLKEANDQANLMVRDMVEEVNIRLDSINTINKEVERAIKNSGQAPNDLLDKREQAILELGEFVDVKAYYQDNGIIDIYTGSGKLPLISSNTLTRLESGAGEFPAENRREIYMSVGGTRTQVSEFFNSGKLAGLLDYRDKVLDTSQNELGVAINGMVAGTNWQHYQGWDANGQPGGDYFKPLSSNPMSAAENIFTNEQLLTVSFNPNPNGTTVPYSNAAGGQPATYADKQTEFNNALDELGKLQPREYRVEVMDTGNLRFYDARTSEELSSLVKDSTGAATGANQTGVTTATGIYYLDGLEFDLSALTPTTTYAEDEFLFRPHKAVIDEMELNIKDTDDVATRGQTSRYYTAAEDTDNDGLVSFAEFSANRGTPGALTTAQIDAFFAAGVGSRIDINSDGAISQEEFETARHVEMINASEPTAGGLGDNVNIANIANLETRKLLFSEMDSSGNIIGEPKESVFGGYSRMASHLGMFVRGTEIQLDSQIAVYDQAKMRREEESGVNLDEEAANLMRFQQAYQASAQLITSTKQIFDTLIRIMG